MVNYVSKKRERYIAISLEFHRTTTGITGAEVMFLVKISLNYIALFEWYVYINSLNLYTNLLTRLGQALKIVETIRQMK